MFVKLNDSGTVFQETGQRKVVKGTRITQLERSDEVDRAIRNKVLVEVREDDYNAQTEADAAADAKAKEAAEKALTPGTTLEVKNNPAGDGLTDEEREHVAAFRRQKQQDAEDQARKDKEAADAKAEADRKDQEAKDAQAKADAAKGQSNAAKDAANKPK